MSTLQELKSKFTDLPTMENDATRTVVRESIHKKIHSYFKYLHDLGVVQVNLIHLIDNAFGGMALYDFMFVVNTFVRSGRVVEFDDGYLDQDTGNPRTKDRITLARGPAPRSCGGQ